MEINKVQLGKFRKDFTETVSSLEKKYGVVIDLGSITFNSTSFRAKLSVDNVGELAEGVTAEQALFNNNASRFGFTENDYGKIIRLGGKSHKFYGFNTNARKNVCMIRETVSGREYITDSRTVRNSMVHS